MSTMVMESDSFAQKQALLLINTTSAKDSISKVCKSEIWSAYTASDEENKEMIVSAIMEVFLSNSGIQTELPKAVFQSTRNSIHKKIKSFLSLRDDFAATAIYNKLYATLSTEFLVKQSDYLSDETVRRVKEIHLNEDAKESVFKIIQVAGKILESAAENARRTAQLFHLEQKKSLDKITLEEEIKRLEKIGAKLSPIQKAYMLAAAVDFSAVSIVRAAMNWNLFIYKEKEMQNACSSIIYRIKGQLSGVFKRLKELYSKNKEDYDKELISVSKKFGKRVATQLDKLVKEKPDITSIEETISKIADKFVTWTHIESGGSVVISKKRSI